MIVITIELWPGGDKVKGRMLGRARIVNTGKGTLLRGDYQAFFQGKTRRYLRWSHLSDFPRQSRNVWELLRRTLNEVDKL